MPGQGMVPSVFGARKLAELRALRMQAFGLFSGLESSAGMVPQLNLGVFSTLGPRYAPMLIHTFQ